MPAFFVALGIGAAALTIRLVLAARRARGRPSLPELGPTQPVVALEPRTNSKGGWLT